MTATNQDVGGTSEPYHAGDSIELIIDVDEDGADKPLTGATLEWALVEAPGATEELNESDTGVDVSITDAANGEVTVTIDADVTDGLSGNWEHELRITDSSGRKSVVTRGGFSIERRANQ